MKKLLISFLAVYLVLTQVAFAQDFSIDFKDNINDEYLATHTNFIALTINNPLREDWFTISVVGFPQDWVVPEESLLRVPTSGSNTLLIRVNPSKDAIPNEYQYFLKVVRPSTKSSVEDKMLINVRQITSAILRDISLSCKACPNEITVSGDVYNVGSKLLNNLVLVAKVGNQQKSFPINKLSVLESKEFLITFLTGDMDPGNYEIDLNLLNDVGMSLYRETNSFNIPVVENIIYDQDVSTTPFGSTITITATNTGNIVAEADLEAVSPSGWYYFFSGPAPTGMLLGKSYWRAMLDPDETWSVTYSEIYWPTYVVIIFGVLIGVFIYWQSTALVFSKKLIRKRGKEVSVSLHLRSKKEGVKRVSIKDVVPSDFSIVSRFETMKPIIRKIAGGVELNWKLGNLNAHEERVLHYTIKPARQLLRKIRLPGARARGIRRRAPLYKRSNKVSVHPGRKDKSIVTVAVKE